MTRRVLALMAVCVLTMLGTVSTARAQGTFHDIGLGRAAFAFWEDHRTETFAFAVAGEGMIYNSDTQQPLMGMVGCAAAGNAKRATFGCGELEEFSIDNDLGKAAAKGRFEAMTIDFATEKMTPGRVSYNLTWTAHEGPTPHSHGGYFFFGQGIGLDASAEIARHATEGVKGRVTASSIGRGPKKAVDAATMMGFGAFLEIHS